MNDIVQESDLMTIEEAARYLNRSKRTVEGYILGGKLPKVKRLGNTLTTRSAVIDLKKPKIISLNE